VTVTVIFDTTALTVYATMGKGALTVGEIVAEVADDASATIGLPVLAVAEAWSLLRKNGDEAARLSRLLDPVRSPVTVLPVASQDARRLGVLREVLGDLSRAQAALVSRANDSVPILTGDGVLYRAAAPGLDILDL
jgi:hypothetical protein